MTDTITDPTAPEATPQTRGKGGAPKHNANAVTHGLRCATLPKGMIYIQRQVAEFRRSLEQAVIRRRGAISVMDAAHINSAVRHEVKVKKIERWQRLAEKRGKPLTVDESAKLEAMIGRATDHRDRCLIRLKLDDQPEAMPPTTRAAIYLPCNSRPAVVTNDPPDAAPEPIISDPIVIYQATTTDDVASPHVADGTDSPVEGPTE